MTKKGKQVKANFAVHKPVVISSETYEETKAKLEKIFREQMKPNK